MKALSEDMDKAEASTTVQLLQKKGLEHESAYLQQLKDEGKFVVEIPKDRNPQDRAQLTLEAMQSGADVIYQAVFFAPPYHKATTGDDKCKIIPFPPGKGFTRMPVPDYGDLFFKISWV